MLSCLIDVAQFVYVLSIHMNDSPDIYADNILQKDENTKTTRIAYFQADDFINWCSKDPLIQELLELIFQISDVVLGLRPSSKQDEITIVKSYHWINFNRSTSKPDSSWCLISMEWWLRWSSSNTNTTESTSPLTMSAATPEAVSSSSIDNMLMLSPSRLVNGNNNYLKHSNESYKDLPPPEITIETKRKKEKLFWSTIKKD
ncbi:unnamed protein product [Rotaria magnacalcarata]|uniref:Uncharacterized protein n=1 Tax=Rotaria magnacalcarata TaxID=392030 RepID=A0A816Y1A9_9BILA|nr:unnamed protein product [Rotaria magnacalcarata]